MRQTMEEIFPLAQARLRERKNAQPGLEGMGTTLACVLASGDAFVVGNIGDSRVYLFRDGVFRQLTEDHTHIQQLQKETGSPADDSLLKNYGHYLTRSLDGGVEPADVFPRERDLFQFKDGDALLLCSDGLIADKRGAGGDQWPAILAKTPTLREAAERLTTAAFRSGSADNISVVLASYGEVARAKTRRPLRPRLRSILLAASVLAVGTALVAAYAWYWPDTSPDTVRPPSVKDSTQHRAPPAARVESKAVATWIPFAEGAAAEGYRLGEVFPWVEYQPSADVDHYEITIGGLPPESVGVNYVDLGKIAGLKPGNFAVRLRVVLKNGLSAVAVNKVRIQQ
jgi:hypothetical protein